MEGWISLYRKILDNPVVCKDAETFAIWCYLLLNATHTEIPAVFKKEKIVLKPGQLITGILSIGNRLSINKDKVQRTLKCFELDKQIEQQTSNQNRLITIVNWDLYQTTDKRIDKQMINKCETDDKRMITNNNVITNNDNNIYLYLLKKYKRENQSNFNEYIKAVSKMKQDPNWDKLDFGEQQKLISEI